MYNHLKTIEFLNNNFNQNINQKILVEAIRYSYEKSAFSTFPYIVYNLNSKTSVEKFNSGNCISLSMFLKNYLKSTYNIDSYLIPATIPNKFYQKEYLKISHVALAIPKNNKKIYVVDLAFYFINPIKVRLYKEKDQTIFSKNIYGIEKDTSIDPKLYTTIDRITSRTKKTENNVIFNEYQNIPTNTIYTECFYNNDVNDKWSYYLREIINPDSAITNFFINILNRPFIVSTYLDSNNICHSDYYIRILASKYIEIKFRNEPSKLIELKGDDIRNNKDTLLKVEKYVGKFFNNSFINCLMDYINLLNKDTFEIKD